MLSQVKAAWLRTWDELQSLVDYYYEQAEEVSHIAGALILKLSADLSLIVRENAQGCLILMFSDGGAFCAIKPLML